VTAVQLLDDKAEAVLEEYAYADDEEDVDEEEEGDNFDSLAENGRVSIGAFKAWDDVKEIMVSIKYLQSSYTY
jgi:hypothetical protein